MSSITDTLRECHRIVWQYRAELESVWPTPTTEDALLFAFTELGEAVDAHLRSKPEYARNRDKDLDVLDELADCAMMLLTAMTDRAKFVYWTGIDEGEDWREISEGYWVELVDAMAIILRDCDDPDVDWRPGGLEFLELIVILRGMDLPARLTARLERIKAKRLAAVA